MKPAKPSRRGLFVLAMMILVPALLARAAEPASAPAVGEGENAPRGKTPEYPVPYKPPTPQQIKQVMDRVRDRLDAGTGTKLLERKTHEPPADLSKPIDLTYGPEKGFGPYSYPMGVAYSGMLLANEVTGDAKYADFVAKRYQIFADNLPALSKWGDDRRNPFRNMLNPTNLDACGAMGASMARAQRMKVGPDLHSVVDHFAEYISTKQFRLEDGTLARKNPFPQCLW